MQVSVELEWVHIAAIIATTLVIVSFEFYFLGYQQHVFHKKERGAFQFVVKRVLTVYLVAIIASLLLTFLYNLNTIVGSYENIFKLIVAVSLPCTMGAALNDLFKKVKI